MKKIVIFASGSGSNAEKIALHFKNNTNKNVVGILTNNPDAKVIERAKTVSYTHLDVYKRQAAALAGVIVSEGSDGTMQNYPFLGIVVVASMLITIGMMYILNRQIQKKQLNKSQID